jgi:hypothetical protein
MKEYFYFQDAIIVPFMLIVLYIIGMTIKKKNIQQRPYYRYFLRGLFGKIFGAITICLVYVYYYKGGDTLAYYNDNGCVSRLFLLDPISAIKFTFSEVDQQIFSAFNGDTGWPIYALDETAVYVTKITWVLSLITFNSFLGQTILLTFVTYFPIWRMYKMFISEFPALQKELAFAFLFIPSVVFWGSGLLKDTLTFSAVSLYASSFYYLVKFKRKYVLNIFFLLISSWVLIKLKPYILFAMLPGTLTWFASYQLGKVKNKLVRSATTPALISLAILVGFIFLKLLGDSFKDYSVDNILQKAMITQQDLKQDYYHGSSFDIGDFDPTIIGVALKAPVAITAALFRPFLWESYNPGMIASGVENLAILIFTVYLLLRLRVYYFIKMVLRNHLLFFSVSFSLFFAFAVGLSTSNFGSLVRYKIPAIPFFVASLIITNYYYQEKKKAELKEMNGDNS